MLCSNSFKTAGVNESPVAYVPNNEERPVFPGTYMGTILLWGLAIDLPIAAVRDALMRAGSHVTLFDQRTIRDTEVELVAGTSLEGLLRIGDERCNLADITGVYLRPQDSRKLPDVAAAGEKSDLWRHALEVEDILLSWCELTSALVLNRPSDMAANGSKPFQASWIESFGFLVPDTLVTTDPDTALDFWQKHDRVIYKSLSGIRSIVSRLRAEHRDRFNDIASCPTQFQQYIAGTEYRVHVVGGEVFACTVISEADDYRYASGQVEMRPCDLPYEVATRCKALADSMNLGLAGLDLRHTPDGRWYCFEVNPSPAFTCFERVTGQPITEAVAHLLASGHQNPSPEPLSSFAFLREPGLLRT
jgi:RimK-like ATP-grasp domain